MAGSRNRAFGIVFAALAVGASFMACSAANDEGTSSTAQPPGTGGNGGSAEGGGGSGVGGDILIGQGGIGGGDGGSTSTGVIPDPCGSQCGPLEKCDEQFLGTDDDCDGQIDEECGCIAGQAHACFKGDPAYRGAPGCFDGTQKCTENGLWGPCNGGVHATPEDKCYEAGAGCHAITAVPFQAVDLSGGLGNYGMGATGETFNVTCPEGVDPCPIVTNSSFTPLQSGEYTVTYTATGEDGPLECTFPLIVGARGLRVELEWEHDLGGSGVDLDLHLHQPGTLTPWEVNGGADQDCGYGNCTIGSFPSLPNWFTGAAPPDPVKWYKDPVHEQNLCYFSPRGAGAEWEATGLGCHNPRLDIDNISCDPEETDVDSGSFCAPENINVDFPPKDEWFRVGVYYFSNGGETYAVHPTVKIYCDGALAAELGSQGYYTNPEEPVEFLAADGGNRMWLVADVKFKGNECDTGCEVRPLYSNATTRTPFFTNRDAAEQSFTPPNYPN